MKPNHGYRGEVCSAIRRYLRSLPYQLIALILMLSGPPITSAYAQAGGNHMAASSELTKGDRLPEEVWNLPLQVVNHPGGKELLRLNDYKGKLIVLEFWATYCGPCIAMLPHLLDIRNRFKGEMVVLPITSEESGLISSVLKNSPSKRIEALRERSFFSIVDDKVLRDIFPSGSLPHTVIIDGNGTVSAITLPRYLHEHTIEQLLAGENPYIPDKVSKVKELPLLLTPSLTNIPAYKPTYYSTVMGELDAVTGSMGVFLTDSANNKIRYIARNNPILTLYAFTGWWMAAVPSRRILEVNNPARYSYYYDEEAGRSSRFDTRWIRENRYTYEAVLPVTTNKKELFLRMQRDLNDFFNVDARVEERDVLCWVLKRLDDSESSFVSKGGQSLHVVNGVLYRRLKGDTLLGPAETGALTYVRNMKMEIFVITCLRHMDTFYGKTGQFAVPPIIDETNYSGMVDIDLPNQFTGFDELRRVLRSQGLDLVPEIQKTEMFVITEPGQATNDSHDIRLTKFGYVPVQNP